MSLGSTQWLKYVLTISLAVMPLAGTPVYAAGGQCEDSIIQACQDMDNNVSTQQYNQMAQNSQGNRNGIQNHSNAFGTASANRMIAAGDCQDMSKLCQQKCTTDQDKQRCEKAVGSQAGQMKAQSAADGAQGGDMGAIAGLLGAAAGIGMAMMNKKKDKQPPPQPVATGALQLNGALNCQMKDSYRYADCASFLTSYCQATASAGAAASTATPATGTIISTPGGGLAPTPDCPAFNANFCSATVTPPQPYGMMRSDGAVTQVNMAGTGGGLGTEYCARTVASSWCTPERAMCPSCRHNEMYNSATCAANPALCQTTTSPQQIAATTEVACQGDPLFTPGSPFAIAGTIDNGSSGNTLPAGISPLGVGVPMVGVGGGGGVGVPVGTGPTTGLPVAVLPKSVSGAGAREGRALGGGKNTSGSNGISGTNIKTSSVHAHASANELIAAGGVILANGPGVPSRGPASDVEGKFGPSLFATSSQVIRQHCDSGKLNCR